MSFKPFPVGTVRGPFTCGFNNQHNGGVQFAVKDSDGCWLYFIRKFNEEGECRRDAEKKAKEILAKK